MLFVSEDVHGGARLHDEPKEHLRGRLRQGGHQSYSHMVINEKCTKIFNNYFTSPSGRCFVLVARLPISNLPSHYNLQPLVYVMPQSKHALLLFQCYK